MPPLKKSILETFTNPAPSRNYFINMEIPEFTSLCPLTGQPDFATFKLVYVPDKLCVELKSLKLYMWSYRNKKAFHEKLTNKILDDIARVSKPKFIRLKGRFFVRGGIFTTITTEKKAKNWNPEEYIHVPSVEDGRSYVD
ncbi:MAG: NADPH-dependent 7-cyano-7-deazaguanine reductase QueF [Proteobacteria bacterium]|nr:NADPH-dependent 7-cyano-7-deazaguanine reductase QueF [Pseudomonadota bacterium]